VPHDDARCPRYLQRLQLDAPPPLTLAGLTLLQQRHNALLPFETLSCLLRDAVPIDLDSVQRKLLDDRRGGYCFELNGGLLALLQALGFDAQPLSARVLLAAQDGELTARTHLLLRVQVDGDDWLVDAGFGSLTRPCRCACMIRSRRPRRTSAICCSACPTTVISCCRPSPAMAGGRCIASTCRRRHRSTTWWATGTCARIPIPVSPASCARR
jgi:arylamine N-acetyltransferase